MEKLFKDDPSKTTDEERGSGSGTPTISAEEDMLNASIHFEDSNSVTNTLARSPQGSNPRSENQPSIHSTSSSWTSGPIPPIAILIIQLIMLIGMISFVIWTSVAHQVVPRSVADLYLNYPQFTTTVITLIGSLLSLINTKLFSDAVRFAICVSLTKKGLSLYSFHAATAVASRSLLFDFDSRRIRWTLTSIIYLFLSTIQISAWSSVITPRPVLIQNQGSFLDVDFAAPQMITNATVDAMNPSYQGFESGIAAVREVITNMKQLLPYSNLIINGTSRGILPIPDLVDYSGNWTRIEVLQQGLSAKVSCETISKADPALRTSSERMGRLFNTSYGDITLSCNSTNMAGNNFIYDQSYAINMISEFTDSYLFSTICPSYDIVVVVFMQLLNNGNVSNMACIVKPQLLNVNVTYANNGIVTIESTTDVPIVLPINTSSAGLQATQAIIYHFPLTQTMDTNNVLNALSNLLPDESTDSDLSPYMAAYLRGVVEDGITMYRQFILQTQLMDGISCSSFTTKVYAQAIVWGQLSQARNLCLERNISFDPMNVLHIITACSSGNVQTIPFPDYSEDVGAFCKYVDVGFPEGRGEIEDVRGFRFSEKQ